MQKKSGREGVMANKEWTQKEIEALPDITFQNVHYGDFVKVTPGIYKQILCVMYRKGARAGDTAGKTVTTRDQKTYGASDVLSCKKNPAASEGPAFV